MSIVLVTLVLVLYLLGLNLAWWVYPQADIGNEVHPSWVYKLCAILWPVCELYSMVMVAIFGED